MAYTLPTTGTDPKTTTKELLEALIDSAIATVSSTGISGFIYATDTADGLARTSDGEGFFTASSLQLIFWLNDAGAATQLSEIGTPLTEVQVNELRANYASIAADAVQTGLDVLATGADAAQTALDRIETGADVITSIGLVADAQSARDLTETYAGIDHRAATWAALALVSGLTGEVGYVGPEDTGTHTDPIAAGTVDNEGVYTWAANGLGSAQAERIASTGLAGLQTRINSAEEKLILTDAGNALLGELTDTGVLPKLSALWVPATSLEGAALFNITESAEYKTTNFGATFETKVGFTGNGSSAYLNTNYEPFSDAAYGQDDAHVGFWIAGANAQEGKGFAGMQGGTGRFLFQPRTTGNAALVRFNSTTTKVINDIFDSRGHMILNRSGASAVQVYRNGGLLASGTEVSAVKLAGNLFVLAQDAVGTSNSARTVSAIHAGSSLTATDAANLSSALNTYLAAIQSIPEIDLFFVAAQSNAQQGSATPPAPTVINGLNYGGSSNQLEAAWGALDTVGFTAKGGAFTGTLWPAFANNWFRATGRVACIVNYARGSTALLAAADTGSGNWSSTGTLRAVAVAKFNKARSEIAPLGKIVSQRVIYMQGETDATEHNGTTVSAATYQAELELLAAYFEANIAGGIAETAVIQTGVHRDGSFATGFAAIQDAQNDACFAGNALRLVNTDAKNHADKMADTLHYNQQLLNYIGGRVAAITASGEELAT